AASVATLAPSPRRRRRRERAGGAGQDGGASAGLYSDRRKSKVWNYYAKLGDAYVECNVCKKQLSFHNSTTTMREHLVRKHGIRDALLPHAKDDQAAEADAAAYETGPKRSRPAPAESFPPHATSRVESRTETILRLVLEMIFRDLHPLSVVKDKGFGLLLAYLEPGFTPPPPAQLSAALRHCYDVAKRHAERHVRAAQALVLCAEPWASHLGQAYVTVVATFVDAEWRRVRCVLETRRARGGGGDDDDDEEDEGLGEELRAALAGFGLSGKSVFCVVHGNAATRPRWPRDTGWGKLCCAARALQLCV
ncbi:ZBED4 protein, partial [Nyctibius bracteatus]|nr:ZBED4 protein [Nyctibius bracteatus]